MVENSTFSDGKVESDKNDFILKYDILLFGVWHNYCIINDEVLSTIFYSRRASGVPDEKDNYHIRYNSFNYIL